MWSAWITLALDSTSSQNEARLAEIKLSCKIKIMSSIFFFNESGVPRSISKQMTAETAKLLRLVQTSRTNNLSSGKGLAEQVLKQIQYQHPQKKKCNCVNNIKIGTSCYLTFMGIK